MSIQKLVEKSKSTISIISFLENGSKIFSSFSDFHDFVDIFPTVSKQCFEKIELAVNLIMIGGRRFGSMIVKIWRIF